MIKERAAGMSHDLDRDMPTMTSAAQSSDLLSRLRNFARGQRGFAAVEFAMILPFMLTAYIGGVEIGDGVAIDRKVAITTHSVADLATRYNLPIANSDIANILGASSAIIAPYQPAPLSVTVSEVVVDPKGNATIAWSDALNGSAHAIGSSVSMPGTLGAATGTAQYYILGEVQYAYTPTLGYVMTGTLNLSNKIFMSPRESACISRVGVYGCP
jgi:Flp pilus assembly protein TadG